GTMIARRVNVFVGNQYKVIALDCDGTLWNGVLGEDGVEGIEISGARESLQEFMVKQHEAGRLICLCSKNNLEDVMEVFNRRSEMRLKPDHITAMRINWNPKSESLKSLSEELNLGLESFIFVDDSEIECAEVEARCGEVLILRAPKQDNYIDRWL